MAATKLTALTALTTPDNADQVYIVDTSDTSGGASGTSKRINLANLLSLAGGGKTEIATITLGTAGEFDFTSIPSGYKRLIIEGAIRGNSDVTNETAHIYFNEELTDGSYHSQRIAGQNGSSSTTEQAEPEIAIIPASSTASIFYASVRVVIEDYTGANAKCWVSDFTSRVTTDHVWAGGIGGLHESMTAAITRIRIRTDNHPTDQLLGKLTLYGEL